MVTHKGTQTLHKEILVLRRFKVEDAKAMFDTWANDERVTRFLTWTPHGTVELTTSLLTDWCNRYENDNYYNWAIEFEGKLIGNISVVQFTDSNEEAALGYCMGYDFWGKGIMTEAAKAVIRFLFEEVQANRIVITHAVKNPASGNVARKCGLTHEGTKRECFRSLATCELLDISELSILKREYEMTE